MCGTGLNGAEKVHGQWQGRHPTVPGWLPQPEVPPFEKGFQDEAELSGRALLFEP
jgi:hypothetical protein